MDSNTQTPIMYYSVQYSSTKDFLKHISLIVPVTTNMITIPAGDSACFVRVSANNSAGYGPFSDTTVTPTPANSKQNNNDIIRTIKCICLVRTERIIPHMILCSTEVVMDITTDSTVSSSVMSVTFSYQPFALRYIVTIEQYNTGGSGRQQKVVSSNQTMLTATFTSLS